jgi:metal-sulfur cluster biosynthetic enzyme
MTDADLLAALRDCYHPVLRRNIVDLDLVRSASLAPDSNAPGANVPGVPQKFIAHLTLTAPTSDDTANAHFVAQIENRLLSLPSISRVDLTLLPALFPIL